LKGWGFSRAGSLKKRKKEIYEALGNLEQKEEESTLNEKQIRGRCTLLAELYKMIEEEELYWFRRCHEKWLLQGDNNT
jgi:hypothetical protein